MTPMASTQSVHKGAATGCDHGRALAQQPFDDAALAVAERQFAVNVENVADGAAGSSFDFFVGIQER